MATTSVRDLLIAELKAIKDRCQKAGSEAEKAMVDSQFGQRIEHLEERLKALEAAPPPAG